MNCIVMCEITLSKKLEKFCESGEPVSIHLDSIRGNKGRGMMRIVVPAGVDLAGLNSVGETSLIVKVVSAEEDVPSMPGGKSSISVFSGMAKVDGTSALEKKMLLHATDSSKLGDPHPMSQTSAEVRQQPQVRQQPPANQEQASRPYPQAKKEEAVADEKTIMSYDELMEALSTVQDIDKEIVMPAPGASKEAREAAIKAFRNIPRMPTRVYAKNLLKSCLVVQDMPLNDNSSVAFQPGETCDLSRFPAKLIRDSNDLRWCIETGKIGFVNRQEYVKYYESLSGLHDDGRGLKVFGTRNEARGNMELNAAPSVEDDGNEITIEDRDGDVPFGDDRQMDNLLKTMPSQK